jgi:hypothetical protein
MVTRPQFPFGIGRSNQVEVAEFIKSMSEDLNQNDDLD